MSYSVILPNCHCHTRTRHDSRGHHYPHGHEPSRLLTSQRRPVPCLPDLSLTWQKAALFNFQPRHSQDKPGRGPSPPRPTALAMSRLASKALALIKPSTSCSLASPRERLALAPHWLHSPKLQAPVPGIPGPCPSFGKARRCHVQNERDLPSGTSPHS